MAGPAWCFSRDARPLPSQPDTATPVPAPAFAGNSLASRVVAVYFSPFLAHFVFAEAFLPQLPVAAMVAADRFQIPVSSHGINASMTECQGDVAVLNVSLPASTFSLTS